MVTFAQAARLVVEHGFVPNMTSEGLRKIARTDPDWPIRENDYERMANARVMPWALVRHYFTQRTERGKPYGRGPAKRDDD